MDPQAFQEMIDRYSEELMRTAARSPHPPAEAETSVETKLSDMPTDSNAVSPAGTTSAMEVELSGDVLTTPPASAAPIEQSALLFEGETFGNTTPFTGPLPVTNRPESGRGQDPLQEIHLETISYEEFLEKNPKTGTLRVQASIAQRTFPVPGAQVMVDKKFLEGNRVFATGVTDENGILDGIVLPAPDKSLSDSPTGKPPYALYDIHVTHPDFRKEVYSQVPVFDGIKSIQPVQFLPNSVLPERMEGEK